MKTFKRLSSLMLALLMICTVFLPTAGAAKATATFSTLPVIYIQGNKNTKIYDKDGNQIWPLTQSLSDAISANKSAIISAGLTGMAAHNWNPLANAIEKAIDPIFKDLRLDKNGKIVNGSAISPKVNKPKVDKDGNYDLYQYQFKYDIRLDSLTVADSLRQYIKDVLTATGKTKVNIIARCMGTSVLAAYLTKYKSDPLVRTAAFYSSACNGVLLEEAPFSGSLNMTPSAIKQFASSSGSEDLSDVMDSLVNFFGSKAVTNAMGDIMAEAMPVVLPRVVRATYGAFPSYWNMLGTDQFTNCKNYLYGSTTLASQYANMLKTIDYYQKNVTAKLKDTLTYLRTVKGVNINIVAKYNVKFDEIYKNNKDQGDSWITVEKQSFGGTAPLYGQKLSKAYCESLAKSGLGNYISGDRVIDATTCLFPDYTWFIKDMRHADWNKNADTLFYAFFSKSTQVTVNTFSNFPQFLRFKDGAYSFVHNYNETKTPVVESVKLSCTDYTYNGNNKTPTVIVKTSDDSLLTKGVDYTVSYSEPRSAVGKYYATVKFIGAYKGTPSQKLSFVIRPKDVTGLKVTVHSSTSCTVSWDKVSGASYYKLYRYIPSTKAWKSLCIVNGTSRKITGLTAGANEKIAVRAIKKVNDKEFFSKNFINISVPLTPPNVTGVKVTAGTKQLTVKWNKSNGATSYQVFRSSSKTGVYRRVATVTTTSFKNEKLLSNRTYYYKVKAIKTVNKTNYETPFSAVVSGKTK